MENSNSPNPFAVITRVEQRRLRSRSRFLATLLCLASAGAAFNCGAAPADFERADRKRYGELLAKHLRSGQQALRVKADTVRGRLWLLSLQQVTVYEIKTGDMIKQIALPAWSLAGIQCAPDLILDASGDALISSNVEPRLWKIDATTFNMKEYAINMPGKENWDNGFGALAFAADGSLYAMSSFAGSLWRIELATSSASEIKLSARVTQACALRLSPQTTARLQKQNVTLCAASRQGARRITIAPDFSGAHVSREQCND